MRQFTAKGATTVVAVFMQYRQRGL